MIDFKNPTNLMDESSAGREGLEQADGSGIDSAVVVSNIPSEYLWLRTFYPEYSVEGQSLIIQGDKKYDRIDIRSPGGEERQVFFDITAGFGKFPPRRND